MSGKISSLGVPTDTTFLAVYNTRIDAMQRPSNERDPAESFVNDTITQLTHRGYLFGRARMVSPEERAALHLLLLNSKYEVLRRESPNNETASLGAEGGGARLTDRTTNPERTSPSNRPDCQDLLLAFSLPSGLSRLKTASTTAHDHVLFETEKKRKSRSFVTLNDTDKRLYVPLNDQRVRTLERLHRGLLKEARMGHERHLEKLADAVGVLIDGAQKRAAAKKRKHYKIKIAPSTRHWNHSRQLERVAEQLEYARRRGIIVHGSARLAQEENYHRPKNFPGRHNEQSARHLAQ